MVFKDGKEGIPKHLQSIKMPNQLVAGMYAIVDFTSPAVEVICNNNYEERLKRSRMQA